MILVLSGRILPQGSAPSRGSGPTSPRDRSGLLPARHHHDPGRKVQKDLDIAEYTNPEHDPLIPHVLEPGLLIFKIYNGCWLFGRPTIEELRQDLRAVLKKCRLDWEIARPELKTACERGEHDRSYPYAKTYGQVFREQA